VSLQSTMATAARVLEQLRRDPRTIALVIAVPIVLIALLKWVFDGQPQTFDRIGGPLVGIFPLISMFLVTSITMLRERVTGTLERLMTMPMSKLDLLAGYGIAFGILAAAQALVVCLTGFWLLGLDAPHGAWLVAVLAILNALLGMALGLLLSAFARTEFQAVQFMPAFIFPQLLLCGLFVPRDEMAPALEAISWLLPFTYAYDGLERAIAPAAPGSELVVDVLVVIACTLAALALGALTLKRRTA